MIQVTVQYFASLRDEAKIESEEISVEPMTARELVNNRISAHGFTLPSVLIRIAINGKFADDGMQLQSGDAVVLIPPVAGG